MKHFISVFPKELKRANYFKQDLIPRTIPYRLIIVYIFQNHSLPYKQKNLKYICKIIFMYCKSGQGLGYLLYFQKELIFFHSRLVQKKHLFVLGISRESYKVIWINIPTTTVYITWRCPILVFFQASFYLISDLPKESTSTCFVTVIGYILPICEI